MGRSTAVRILLLALPLLAGSAAVLANHLRQGVRIEPSQTWVGLARVHLEVSDLWLVGHLLEGRYDIRVPMLPSRNDSGTIRLELPVPLESLRTQGGRLAGRAVSAEDGTLRTVACDVENDGDIVIEVAMPERTLEFRSRYRTLDEVLPERL